MRAGLSRSYYAAFLHCRVQLAARGMMVSQGTGADHRLVQTALSASDRPMGHALQQLRNARNRADYDLNVSVSQSLALAMCAAAQIILTF